VKIRVSTHADPERGGGAGGPEPSDPEALRVALLEHPDDPVLLAKWGIALAERGRVDEALDALDRAHYLRPHSPQILFNYGLALERAGRPAAAARRYQAVLSLKPDYARANERLLALAAAGGGLEPREALAAPPERAAATPPQAEVTPAPPPREIQPLKERRTDSGADSEDDWREIEAVEREAIIRELVATPVRASGYRLPGVGFPFDGSPPVHPEWEPESLPGPVSLGRLALMLWCQQPLLWLGVVAVPNAIAAFLAPMETNANWWATVAWVIALALSTGPLVGAMVETSREGRPLWRKPAAAATLSLPYLAIVLLPFCWLLSAQSALPGWAVVLLMLLLTGPFHLLVAPALVLASEGRSPLQALSIAFNAAGPRVWLHLLVMVIFGLALAGLLAFCAHAAVDATRGLGQAVDRALEAAALCLAESIWAALITISGLDTLAARASGPREAQPGEEAPV
jgi:tetratricopeptide (TPR) repeat protein